ncbi:MAG: P-II family nitrogen regulator, partial [Coriobacteriales bacterium]|nr:P-II family nitrogen regulator [Coriobacteriales bacterium]
MIKIEAIVREEALEDVKEALLQADVRGITVSQVMGCGTQMGYTQVVRGNKVSATMLPKIKFEIVVSNEDWAEKTIRAIQKAAYSGNPGDGKIFAYQIDRAIRIRTGE